MSAPDLAGKPTLRIRGRAYPVLLPSLRDPRLLTRAWCGRIAAAIERDPGTGAFEDFVARRPELLRR